MMKQLAVSALLAGAASTVAIAQSGPPQWSVLGTRDASPATAREIDVVAAPSTMYQAVSIEADKGVPIVDKVIIDFADHTHQIVPLEQRKIDQSNPRLVIPFRDGGKPVNDVIVVFGRDSYGSVIVSAN